MYLTFYDIASFKIHFSLFLMPLTGYADIFFLPKNCRFEFLHFINGNLLYLTFSAIATFKIYLNCFVVFPKQKPLTTFFFWQNISRNCQQDNFQGVGSSIFAFFAPSHYLQYVTNLLWKENVFRSYSFFFQYQALKNCSGSQQVHFKNINVFIFFGEFVVKRKKSYGY